MRRFFLSVVVSGLVAGGIMPAQGQMDDGAAVRQTLEAFAEFVQTKELASIDTLWATGRGVHIIEGAGVDHGWPDYRDNHLGRELESFDNLAYRFYSIEPQVRGAVAWAAFRYELSADTPRGRLELEGRATAVLEKQNDRWIIAHLHTSGRRRRGSGAAQSVSGDSIAVASTVERFHKALAEGDSLAALALLSEDLRILESGTLETRAEYRSGHLRADIGFASAVASERGAIHVVVRGDVAWATSTSVTQGEVRGRAIDSRGAELMVLTRGPNGWKIRAVHWSSRSRMPSRDELP